MAPLNDSAMEVAMSCAMVLACGMALACATPECATGAAGRSLRDEARKGSERKHSATSGSLAAPCATGPSPPPYAYAYAASDRDAMGSSL